MSFAPNWPRPSPGWSSLPSFAALSRDPQLSRALLLALLLHLLLVLLVGNTPGGSAKPGEGVWGSLSVRLRSGEPSDPRPGPPRAAPPEQPVQGPEGKARGERIGGQVRREDEARSLPPTPGTAREGLWNAQPGEVLEGETSAPQPTLPPVQPAPMLKAAGPEAAPLRQPEPALAPARLAPLPQLQPLPEAPSLPAPQLRQLPAPSTSAPVAAAVGLAPAPALAAEALQPLPPAPRAPRLPQAAPAPLAATRLPSAAVSSLSPLPQAELPALPEPVTRSLAAPAALGPAEPAQALTPLSPVAAAASAVESLSGAPIASGMPELPERRLQQLPAADASSQGLQRANSSQTAPLNSGQALPAVAATPAMLPALPPPPVIGAPDAGPRLGQDVATPPSAAASAPPPKLNLSLPRGGETSGRESRSVLQLMPHPPERKNKLQQGIEDATRKDCREAHADKGLLAAVPLVLGAGSDKGCRW
ncbi:MAG: hypothetical protein ACOVLH_07485 [Roseateles sp.]